ncbi:MAG: ribulokinase [Planctomycetia bacterium]|nr:ribulokinase [Planctomycetia bacterium]
MAKGKFTIGVDFGTESARALLVRVADGKELASKAWQYSNGVITERLPGTSVRIEHDWALQDPQDYVRALEKTVPAVLHAAKVKAEDVIGIAIDFTACTMLPTTADGTPLCTLKQWRKNPHSWVKLWKHHAAQPEADKVNETARRRDENWLTRYGGRISSEWFFPKALQILDEAPEIYEAADRLIEGADWVIWQLSGVETRNLCTAGYKAVWSKSEGFPQNDFFWDLDPRFEKVIDEKMSRDIQPLGGRAGGLTAEMAKQLKLKEGIAVAVANVDAHVAVPACTVTGTGKMVMIMGTSNCHMVCGTEEKHVPGQCGVVEDGILPGLFGFEAGQCAVGDIFAWFVNNCVPSSYHTEARRAGLDIHALLARKAARYKPGETGLLALDWWNGNRSVLVDADLSGVMLGMTLGTRPEEMYRAILEATAFGTYKIIRTFEEHGVAVDEIYCCGGLPGKNPLLMQIYSDVVGREFKIARSAETCALGSAMQAAVAAGEEAGGYATIADAAAKMAGIKRKVYRPNPKNHATYDKLFVEYEQLHDYFGRGANDVMKRLKAIKGEAFAR